MRKWNELSKKEKAAIIATGTIAGVLALTAGYFGISSAYYKRKYLFMDTLPETHPLTKSRIVFRPDAPDKIKYALQLFYAKDCKDDQDPRFVGEVAFSTAEELADFGKWIMDESPSLSKEDLK